MSSAIEWQRHPQWLEEMREEVLEPQLPIIDAHHHLWTGYGKPVPWQPDYWVEELASDLFAGHDIRATIFVECGYGYRADGPATLKPVGETETMTRFAAQFEQKFAGR